MLVDKISRDLCRTDFKVTRFSVENIVSCAYLGFNDFDLDAFVADHQLECEYSPESFPGLYWRADDHLGFVLFQSGKSVSTGCKNFEQLKKAELYLRGLEKYSRSNKQYKSSKDTSTQLKRKRNVQQLDQFADEIAHEIMTYNPATFFEQLAKTYNPTLKLHKPTGSLLLRYQLKEGQQMTNDQYVQYVLDQRKRQV